MPILMFIWKDSRSNVKQLVFQWSSPHSGCLELIEQAQGQEQAVTPLSPSSQASTSMPQSALGVGCCTMLCGTLKVRQLTSLGSKPWATLKLKEGAQYTYSVFFQNSYKIFIIFLMFCPVVVEVSTVLSQTVWNRIGPYSEFCSSLPLPVQLSLMGISFLPLMIWSWMQPAWDSVSCTAPSRTNMAMSI